MTPIQQTPSELLDYTIDWSSRGLGTDTIASTSWAPSSADLTISTTSFTTTTTTFWLTGGTPGNTYTITNTINTSAGREMQETVVYLCIAQRTI